VVKVENDINLQVVQANQMKTSSQQEIIFRVMNKIQYRMRSKAQLHLIYSLQFVKLNKKKKIVCNQKLLHILRMNLLSQQNNRRLVQ